MFIFDVTKMNLIISDFRRRKKIEDKVKSYPNCEKMSEVSLAGLIDNLIFVLGKEAKKETLSHMKKQKGKILKRI